MFEAREVSTRGARVALFVLCLVALFNFLDRSLLSILQIPVKAELGLSDGQLGALTGLAFTICYAASAIPLARLVDRMPRVLILGVALAIWTTMTALTGLANSFLALVLLRIGVALGEAAATPATHSLIADYFKEEHRGRAFALWALALPIGMMFGVFAGGWLGEDLGWRWTFAIVGAAGLLLVPLLLLQPEPQRGRFERSKAVAESVSLSEGLTFLWQSRAFRLLVLGTTMQGLTYSTVMAWLPPFYSRIHGLSLMEVATTVGLMVGIGAGLGSLLGGVVLDRLIVLDTRWYGRLPALASLACLPLLAIQLFVPSYPLAVTFGILGMIAASIYIAPVNAAAQAMVSSNIRGLTSAVLLVIPNLLGAGVGPWLTGLLSDWFSSELLLAEQSIRWALAVALSGSGAALLLFWSLGREMPNAVQAEDQLL